MSPTPGIAHSPQSFLLMEMNCRMGRLDAGWDTFCPLASTFHLQGGGHHSSEHNAVGGQRVIVLQGLNNVKLQNTPLTSLKRNDRLHVVFTLIRTIQCYFSAHGPGSLLSPSCVTTLTPGYIGDPSSPRDDGVRGVVGPPASQQPPASQTRASTRVSVTRMNSG